MCTCKIIMYTCKHEYVYKHVNYVCMQENHVYMQYIYGYMQDNYVYMYGYLCIDDYVYMNR